MVNGAPGHVCPPPFILYSSTLAPCLPLFHTKWSAVQPSAVFTSGTADWLGVVLQLLLRTQNCMSVSMGIPLVYPLYGTVPSAVPWISITGTARVGIAEAYFAGAIVPATEAIAVILFS